MQESPALDVMGLLHGKGAKVSYRPTCRKCTAGWSGLRHQGRRSHAARSPSRLCRDRHRSQGFDYEAIVAEADTVVDTRNAIESLSARVSP
jgi:UDP-N-acetyl-D-mannosaminuronate dehydrogenase